jgi:uncharacterized membrane protein (DUF485 family)
MQYKRADVQSIKFLDGLIAALALGFGALYIALWSLTPGLMQMKLYSGSAIPVGVLLAVVFMFISVVLAWVCAHKDGIGESKETYEVSHH